ncbi:G2/mitotic-specific cyclin-B2 [Bonamia ostreae]|uniref:G2/mitotic-specific cyclin-B2 n=1 Tax=Bonamia ostreae TaxID=126728 RepID=A0ABV2AJ15_9EUKA
MPYTLSFARRFLRVAMASRFERRYCEYLLELSLLDCDAVCLKFSKLAAAAVYLVLRFKDPFIDEKWSNLLEKHTKYERKKLKPIAAKLLDLVHQNSAKSKAVFRKFSRQKYGAIAKLPIKTLMNDRLKMVQNIQSKMKEENFCSEKK